MTQRQHAPPLRLTVNGEPYGHRGRHTLDALLDDLGIGSNPVAVLINDDVVNEKDRRRVSLETGDRVEVLTFAGGG
jgi:thiamine biosynthesis protein ThiS